MKKFTTLLLLFAAAVLGAAAQTVNATAAQQLTISSSAPATATGGTVSYQWYRNGLVISGATAATYTIPAADAYFCNQRFQRLARASGTGCTGSAEGWSNEIVISFCTQLVGTSCTCQAGTLPGLVVGSVQWAPLNVGTVGVFAANHAHASSNFYNFNSSVPWPTSGAVSGYPASSGNVAWAAANSPCPSGWRVPTQTEFQALVAMGSTWVAAGTRGAPVNGRFYGDNHSIASECTVGGTMRSCIFLPAVGHRTTNGTLQQAISSLNGYWASEQASNNARAWHFTNAGDVGINLSNKAHGFSVRCVR